MIITELITIGTTPDVRTNPNGHRTMYFRGACERPMSEGTEWLSVYISDPHLSSASTNSTSTRAIA